MMFPLDLDQLMRANMMDREREAAALQLSREATRGRADRQPAARTGRPRLALPRHWLAGHLHFTRHA